jgi:hypothetical protein
MKYRWTECPGCRCEVAINYSDVPGGITGSVRRWSRDRVINDGKPLQVASEAVAADGSFTATCVCGQTLSVPAVPDAIGATRDFS